jgi:spore coat polysaccharide biosynthesis protein SpsF
MSNFATEQEAFWAGEFGDGYVERNKTNQLLTSNLAFFARILAHTDKIESVLELGANIGLNLRALKSLLPTAQFSAVEINEKAAAELRTLPGLTVHHQSLLEFQAPAPVDFVLIKGVLIHLQPEKLPDVYRLMHAASRRYICLAEYYNPTPVSIPYRGHSDRLFKRDFAGEMLKQFPDLKLRDYGFAYHGDQNFAQDDITWFLLEKTTAP